MSDRLEEILYSFSRYVAHHEKTGVSTGLHLNQPEAKQALQSYIDSKIIEARKEVIDEIVEEIVSMRKRAEADPDVTEGGYIQALVNAEGVIKALNHRKER